jgi:hypothetical protein
MKHTCDFNNCKLAHKMKLKCQEECCNYIGNWFIPINEKGIEGQPELIHDCAPIRTNLMMQNILSRLDALQTNQDNLKQKMSGTLELTNNILNKAYDNYKKQLEEYN